MGRWSVAGVQLRRLAPEKLSEKHCEPGRHEGKTAHQTALMALHLLFVARWHALACELHAQQKPFDMRRTHACEKAAITRRLLRWTQLRSSTAMT